MGQAATDAAEEAAGQSHHQALFADRRAIWISLARCPEVSRTSGLGLVPGLSQKYNIVIKRQRRRVPDHPLVPLNPSYTTQLTHSSNPTSTC